MHRHCTDIFVLILISASSNRFRQKVGVKRHLQMALDPHFLSSSLKDLFERADNRNVLDFTKETHFYNQL